MDEYELTGDKGGDRQIGEEVVDKEGGRRGRGRGRRGGGGGREEEEDSPPRNAPRGRDSRRGLIVVVPGRGGSR